MAHNFRMTLHAPYPHGRPRRLRRDDFTRNLVREHALTPHDLIYLNSFFNPRFTQQVLVNRWLGRLPPRPIVIAPRGEFSAGALQIKAFKKVVYLGLVKWSGLYDDLVWQASSAREAEEIRRGLHCDRLPSGLMPGLPGSCL